MSEVPHVKNGKFPDVADLFIPKEVCLGDMIKTLPDNDGRGVVIAILDTGVDPSLPGMQTTSDGKRKIIDLYDASGSGDVDCSKVARVKDGYVTGLTGRKLKIPESWVNPTGRYYMGSKPIHELYSKGLKSKLHTEKKEEVTRSAHNLALADARRKLALHEKEIGGTSQKAEDRVTREDLACQVDFLKSSEDLEDKGPVADCLMWHDGVTWKACLDTSFRGRLKLAKTMSSYNEGGEFAEITVKDQLVYSFRIDGTSKILEIVTVCGAHGSHVAAIAAAHRPDNRQLDGIAPGAQIVSICIGDNRLGGMETGTALTRAFNICTDLKVDVINMSYGESVDFPNKGRVIEEAKKLVKRTGVMFLSSAGNQGPALSTVGCPGGTTSEIISVGAALCPNMLNTMYGMTRQVDEPEPYPWSSNGPTDDGAFGVDIYAPGAAYTEVPRFCRRPNQLMNGTSMSSPNAAGAVACLISSLGGKKYSPYEIRLAIQNGAKYHPKLLNSAGMLHVPSAVEQLEKQAYPLPITHFEVECSRSGILNVGRGIYLRNKMDLVGDQSPKFTIHVKPNFLENADLTTQTAFELPVHLKWQDREGKLHDPAVAGIEVPTIFVVTSHDSSFQLKIDMNKYNHRGAIVGVDNTDRLVFRVPVNIITPSCQLPNVPYKFNLRPGEVQRYFQNIYHGTTAVALKLRLPESDADRYIFHAMQVLPNHAHRKHELHKFFGGEIRERNFIMKVEPEYSLELALCRTSGADKEVSAEVEVIPMNITHDNVVHLSTGTTCNRFDINLSTVDEGHTKEVIPPVSHTFEVAPSISLKTAVSFCKPTEMTIEPLGPRDVFSDGIQINRILLTYKINVAKSGEHQFELGGISDYLYENPLDDLHIQIFSPSKEYIGSSSSFRDRYNIKLEKGEYKVLVQVRHTDESVLEKLKDSVLSVHQKLASPVSIDCYKSAEGVTKGDSGQKWTNKTVKGIEKLTCFVSNIPEDKLPKNVASGGELRGSLTIFSNTDYKEYTVPVVLHVVAPESKRQSKALSQVTLQPKEEVKEPMLQMQEAIRDTKIEWITKIKEFEKAEEVFKGLETEFPTHLPLHTSWLKQLISHSKNSPNGARKLVEHSEKIFTMCEPKEVLVYMGTKQNENSVERVARSKIMEERKTAVIDAHIARVNLYAEQFIKNSKDTLKASALEEKVNDLPKEEKETDTSAVVPEPDTTVTTTAPATDVPAMNGTVVTTQPEAEFVVTVEELDKAVDDMLDFIKDDDSKVQLCLAKYAIAKNQYGRAIKMLQKYIENERGSGRVPEFNEKLLGEIAGKMGWHHLGTAYRNECLVRNRPDYRPF